MSKLSEHIPVTVDDGADIGGLIVDREDDGNEA
jgi:hypothetical protein